MYVNLTLTLHVKVTMHLSLTPCVTLVFFHLVLQVVWTDSTEYTIYRPYGEFFKFQSKVRPALLADSLLDNGRSLLCSSILRCAGSIQRCVGSIHMLLHGGTRHAGV